MLSKKRLGLLIALCSLFSFLALACWQQASWRGWFYARQLSSARPEKLADYTSKLEHLDRAGMEAVVNLFRSPRERACQNAGFALEQVLNHWGSSDSRYEATLNYLADSCAHFSPLGQREALAFLQQLFADQQETTPGQLLVASRLLSQVGAQAEARLAALEITAQLLRHEGSGAEALLAQAKAWVVAGLKDQNPAIRAAAVRLAVVPMVRAYDCLPPLLLGSQIDPSSDVRQLVILALGDLDALLPTDPLCRFLNDESATVRLATERALRARGLSSRQVMIAKLMNHPEPATRAEVAALACDNPEVDSYVWMEKLSHDPVPAVRAAAARAMGQHPDPRLLTLMRHLAEEDVDPTVQEIARFFVLEHLKNESR